ncbi:carbohydrate-binding protein, partial [Flavivirga aquimarina]
GKVIKSKGDFSFAPIMDVPLNRSGQDIELTIMPSPDAIGPHNIANIDGNNHNIVFHRTEGPIDNKENRAIVISGNNSTIVNETEYAIVLESGTSGNTITSCGPVTDNGSNSVTHTSNCFNYNYEIGLIQAEGYNDMSGVQAETCADIGGGLNIGYIHTGDWMEYEVVVPSSGNYTINYRVASKNGGGSVQFKENGTTKATTNIASTGNWQNWTTLSTSVSLSAGTQTIQLYAASGGWNINWFEIVPDDNCASFSTIQAENFDSMSGIIDEGANIGYIHNGDWAMYSNVDLTCASNISVRASSKNNSGNIEVRLGSTTGTLIGTVAISTTGNWNTWETSSTSLSSVTGTHDVYLVFTGGTSYLFNIDWFEFSNNSNAKAASTKTSIEPQSSLENNIMISPNPINNLLTVHHLNSNYKELMVFNFNGSMVIHEKINGKEKKEINTSRLSQGLYFLKLIGVESSKTLKFIKN